MRNATCFRSHSSCERARAESSEPCFPKNTAACFAILNTSEVLCYRDPPQCEAAVKLLPEEMPLSACEVDG
jgi:hypothetical protein